MDTSSSSHTNVKRTSQTLSVKTRFSTIIEHIKEIITIRSNLVLIFIMSTFNYFNPFIVSESLRTQGDASNYTYGPFSITGRPRTLLVSDSFETNYMLLMFSRDNSIADVCS